MAFQVGETVGRYRIIEQLGQGGMATVFKAYHAELDRFVALKVLHPAFMEDSSFLARFKREARLVAKLDHPNIVPIYDYAEHEGRPYLVMKFIEGETLKSRLGRGELSTQKIQSVVEAVGAALGYAHKQGILHRDMKPSNVLLANDEQIYLADFGLARIAQSGESTLTSDMILGTPQYISPEQALGKKDLDEGTDIYSFGVMLYEMAVGKVPFNADTPFSVIHDHIYSPLPLPRTVNAAVSEDVERVLLKALSKERSDRYKDVNSLVTAYIQALLAGMPALSHQSEDKTIPYKPDAVTLVPASQFTPDAPREQIPAAAQEVPGGEKSQRKQKKTPWMWLAVMVIFLLGCFFVAWAIRTVRPFRSVPTVAVIVETPTYGKTLENMSYLEQAQREVESKPNDPGAHMQLALAFAQGNMPQKAQDEITQVERLAASDEAFLWNATRDAAEKGAWLAAARLAVDAAALYLETNTLLPEDLRTLLHETVYKAMKDQLAVDYNLPERLASIDKSLSQLATARYTYFIGNPVEAQGLLDDLSQEKPGFVEAQLLQADFSSRAGDFERARQALKDLRANPGVTPWIMEEANIIEGTLRQ